MEDWNCSAGLIKVWPASTPNRRPMFNLTHVTRKTVARAVIIAALAVLASCSSPEERANAHYTTGVELMEKNEVSKARLEFLNAVKLNDKLVDAWFQLAVIAEREGSRAASRGHLEKVLDQDPDHHRALVKLAGILLLESKIEPALSNINRANDLKNDDTDILALRAAILLRLNDREGARRDAEKALASNPDNPEAHYVLAADQLIDENSKSALLFIDRGLSTAQDHLGLLLLKLGIAEKANRHDEVETIMRRLVKMAPRTKNFRRALISHLASRNKHAEAEAEMRGLLEIDPNNISLALEMVRLVGSLNGDDAAREELKKLISNNPETIDYTLALALFEYSKKDSGEATKILRTTISDNLNQAHVERAKVMLADIMLKTGESAAGLKLIDEVLSQDAKNVEALAVRAEVNLAASNYELAISDLRSALSQQPESTKLLNLIGRAFELKGSINLARERFAQAVRLADYAPRMSMNFSQFLIRHGDQKQAEAVLAKAADRNPANVQLLNALARVRLGLQDFAGARVVAETLRNLEDGSGAAQQILGIVQLGQQQFKQSIETFRGVYEARSQATPVMLSLVRAYTQDGQIDNAEAFLNSVLAANDKNADALVLLGAIRSLQKRPEEAKALYKRAVDDQPDRASGYIALANYHLSKKEVEEAESVLRRGHAKVPRDYVLGITLAGILEAKNDADGAIALYEEMLIVYPEDPAIRNNLASLLADHRLGEENLNRADRLARNLRTLDVPFFNDTLGWIAYRKGDHETAVRLLRDAAGKLPKQPLPRYHLGMAYLALEKPDEALQNFVKARETVRQGDPLAEKITEAIDGLNQSAPEKNKQVEQQN